MKRFMGMMPSEEIERSETFKDQYDYIISIDAGPHGWTVRWADGASNYKDVDATTDENFNSAKEFVESKGFVLQALND